MFFTAITNNTITVTQETVYRLPLLHLSVAQQDGRHPPVPKMPRIFWHFVSSLEGIHPPDVPQPL